MRNKMLNTNMRFDVIFNNQCIMGEFAFYDDSSLVYQVDNGGFNVLLGGNWALSLIVDYKTGRVEGFETLFNALNIIESELTLPICQKGTLFFSSNEELIKGSGCHYLPFENKIYYDAKNKIMCIGNRNADGMIVEFANSIIAVVNNSKLVTMYMNLREVKISV